MRDNYTSQNQFSLPNVAYQTLLPIDTYSPMYRQALVMAMVLMMLSFEELVSLMGCDAIHTAEGEGRGCLAWSNINTEPLPGCVRFFKNGV